MYISVRSPNDSHDKFSKNVIIKPEIMKFTANTVIFEDSSEEAIDDIIFCTGKHRLK